MGHQGLCHMASPKIKGRPSSERPENVVGHLRQVSDGGKGVATRNYDSPLSHNYYVLLATALPQNGATKPKIPLLSIEMDDCGKMLQSFFANDSLIPS
jgi:hypothetical protein